MIVRRLAALSRVAASNAQRLNTLTPAVNRFYFSDEPPKGFDKFKRREKSPTKQTMEIKTEDSTQQPPKKQSVSKKKSTIDPSPEEQQKNSTVLNSDNSKSDQKQSDKDEDGVQKSNNNSEQPDKDKEKDKNKSFKINFTYNAKFFGFGDKKKDAASKKKGEEGQESKSGEEGASESGDKKDEGSTEKPKVEESGTQFSFAKIKEKGFKLSPAMIVAMIGAGGLLAKFAYDYLMSAEHISYNDFVTNYFERDLVKAIQIHRLVDGSHYRTYAVVQMTNGEERALNLGNVDHFLENLERLQTQKGKDPNHLIPVDFHYSQDANKQFDRIINLVYLGATIGIMYALFKSLRSTLSQVNKGNDVFGMGKSNVKVFGVDTQVKVRFKDVAGQDEAKNEITEFVDFLKKPKKYKDIGAKLPRGALLAGPPGTGKTMLAKACAGEAGVPFFYISGSDFVEMFVGVGASRVRDLFKQAKAKSPSIIFIDEIDAVGRKRESRIGGNDERDNTLNQLLVEMDGFSTDQSVIVLAATNRKELLDPALTRPGRFDRTVDITLPDLEGRKQIFLVHLKPLKLDPSRTTDEYARRLATLSPGFSGAEIANLCNEAAIMAARGNKKAIDSHDFEMASERVLAGLEKKKIVSEEERRIVAVHESGHAVVSWFLEGGHPLLKLTIIPRSKGSLGFAQYLPNESSLETKQELLDKLCSILGGRCAEEAFFGRITTGAYDDLKKAYEMAYAMVSKYGMSEKLGYIGYVENDYSKSYSDQTNKLIDDEIKVLIDEATVRTRALIAEKKDKIEALSARLLEKETLDLRQIRAILGERPFAAKSNYKAYLEVVDEVPPPKTPEEGATDDQPKDGDE